MELNLTFWSLKDPGTKFSQLGNQETLKLNPGIKDAGAKLLHPKAQGNLVKGLLAWKLSRTR